MTEKATFGECEMSGKLLITYRCNENGQIYWGYSINHSINAFIEKVEKYTGTYLIVNTIQITDEQAARWDGQIKGF